MNKIWYHGTNHEISRFSDEFVGKDEATDQEGPGIYFTDNETDALGYGKRLYSVELNPKKIVSVKRGKASRSELERLIKFSPDWEEDAQNWDENPVRGLRMAIDAALEYNDTPHEQFQQIWIDFFRYKPMDYVRGMVKLGYSGVMVKRPSATHFIVLDPSIIKVLNVNVSEVKLSLKAAWNMLNG